MCNTTKITIIDVIDQPEAEYLQYVTVTTTE